MKTRRGKKLVCFLTALLLLISCGYHATVQTGYAEENLTVPERTWDLEAPALELQSASYVLMEGSTGTVLYEKNMHEVLPPASITKIMTLLLIYEALEAERIVMGDIVTVSDHAASMGGSQVFLEVGETQTVETMIKCISIASANDACVAMAEHLAGSEEAFVKQMNEKAKQLGMNDTVFVNCCGLDVEGHVSSAYDVALMSRELITRFPEISTYATTWMDTIIHTTRNGQSSFGLTNTNKLVKQYQGITGLKTGSTAKAKYCLSATANRNEIDMIAVIMAAPETKIRFQEAAKLLNYGFANCEKYVDAHEDFPETKIPITGGVADTVTVVPKEAFTHLFLHGESKDGIEEKVSFYEKVRAPIEKGAELGLVTYYQNGKELGFVPLVATEEVKKATYMDYLRKVLNMLT